MVFLVLPPHIPSTVLFTNGSAAPIAGANSPCFPRKMVIFRSAKNGSSVTFCLRNSRSASVKYGTRNPLRITSLSMTVLTFQIAAASLERYSSQIVLLCGSFSRTDAKMPQRNSLVADLAGSLQSNRFPSSPFRRNSKAFRSERFWESF